MTALVSTSGYAWIGNYQRPGSTEPADGWDMCPSGETVNFTNWAPGEPNEIGIASWRCADLVIGGSWYDMGCSMYITMPCLCEYGADASPDYLSLLNAELQALQAEAARLLGSIVALWLLPALVALVALGYCKCCRCACCPWRVMPPTTLSPTPTSPPPPSAPTTGAALDAAEKAAKERHARVAFTTAQLGWMLITFLFAPNFFWVVFGTNLSPVIGSTFFYFAAAPWAGALLLLTLRPIDAAAIRGIGIFTFCGLLVGVFYWAYLAASPSFSGRNPIVIGSYAFVSVLCLADAVQVLPILICRPNTMCMPPRRMLLRLWFVFRLGLGGAAAVIVPLFFYPLYFGGRIAPIWTADDLQTCSLANFASCLLAALVLTPANRGRVLRLLAAITSTRGSSYEHEAASVAALLSNRSATTTLAMGAERFRALPFASLTRAELAMSTPDPAMHAKTVPATLGSVHAFLSHSWGDDGDAKFDKVHEWAGGEDKLVWLDKACIDQRNVSESLACLPVFLAGCKQLFVLAGPSYTSRLWCVMELFIFVRMGGQRADIIVELLGDETDDLTSSLATFDCYAARCYLDRDRQGLLAVIEASFGTVEPFNTLVRGIFLEQVTVPSELPAPARLFPIDARDGLAPIYRFIEGLGGGLLPPPQVLPKRYGHRLLGQVDPEQQTPTTSEALRDWDSW